MEYKIKNKKGFTLIEIMVSMTIFFVIFSIALNTFFYANKLQQKMLVFYNVESNFQSSLYKMMNNIENSLIDFDWYTDSLDDTNPLNELHLINSNEVKFNYKLNGTDLEFDNDNNASTPDFVINNSDTEIDRLNFYINVMKIGEEKEIALINTVISGKFTDELNRKNDFNYQFTIEQIINPYYMGTASSWCEGEGTVCDTKTQACTVTNGSGHKNITKLCNATNECLPPEYASECIVDVCDLGYYKAGNACTNCECTIGNNVSIKDNPALLWDPTFDDEDQRWCENICQQFSCDNIPDRGVFILRDDDLDGIYEVERYYSGNNYYALSTAISDAITGDKIYVGGGEYTFAGGNFDTGEKGIDLIICKDASISPD